MSIIHVLSKTYIVIFLNVTLRIDVINLYRIYCIFCHIGLSGVVAAGIFRFKQGCPDWSGQSFFHHKVGKNIRADSQQEVGVPVVYSVCVVVQNELNTERDYKRAPSSILNSCVRVMVVKHSAPQMFLF